MQIWTARFNRPYSGGLAIVAAETEERAMQLLKADNCDWDSPVLLHVGNVECCEGILDSDYYSE